MKKLVEDFKIGLKLMKYGIQFKLMVINACIFLVLGIGYMIFGGPTEIMLGMMLLTMCGSYFLQPLFSTSITGCVASSPMNKCVLFTLPVTISGVGAVAGYLIGVTATLIKFLALDGYMLYRKETYTVSQIAILLVTSGALAIVLQIYSVVVYRFYFAAMIVFFVVFFGAFFYCSINNISAKFADLSLNLPVCAVCGLALILVGYALSYLVARVAYKKPIDAWYYKRTISNGLK